MPVVPCRFPVPMCDIISMVRDVINFSPDEEGVMCARDILNNMQHLYYIQLPHEPVHMVWGFRDGEKVREQYKRLINK